MDKKNLKILLIDDDTFLLELYNHRANILGIDLISAKNTDEAEKIIKENNNVDVLIVDVDIDKENGLDFISKIKKDHLISEKSKIIVLTNSTDPHTIERSSHLNIDSFIVKSSLVPSEVLDAAIKLIN